MNALASNALASNAPASHALASQSAARGVSLVEALVALLVFAVGVLGLAGLQLSNAQNNRAALHRSLAAILASDMLERMRANGAVRYPDVGEGPPGGFVNCAAGDCAPAELASFDVAMWKCSLGRWAEEAVCAASDGANRARLPGGDGTLVHDADGAVTVTVFWRGPGAGRVILGSRL